MKANELQEQGDWMLARAGKFTASRASDLMAKTRSGPSASRANLIATLAVERLTGKYVETYQNAAMARGVELEAEARDAFMFESGLIVQECGFIQHPTMQHVGCSPDGLIGADELLEIKCPASMAKHLDALRNKSHATEYAWQLQHQLMVTGCKRVHMVSYDPRFVGLELAVAIVERDEEKIADLIAEIQKAEVEVMNIVDELRAMPKAA